MNLDVKDRKIMFWLAQNARIPTSRIAKKTGLSQQTVDYRIRRLLRYSYIAAFTTEINLSLLGFERYTMYLQFQNVDANKEREIINSLCKHPFLTWLISATHKWSIVVDIIAKDVRQVNEIVKGIKEQYSPYLGDYKITAQIECKYFHTKYYGFSSQEVIEKEAKNQSPLEHIDLVDLNLMKELSLNSRMTLVELSKKLHIPPTTINYRIKKLLSSGHIVSFVMYPNRDMLGFEQYNVELIFQKSIPERERTFMNYISQHPNVNYYYRPMGPWNIEIGIFVKNHPELRKIILDIRNKFSDIIKMYDNILFHGDEKVNIVPEGVFYRQEDG